MITIGLTGGIGSGKSIVANLFQEFGIAIIDTDHIAHEITRSQQPAFEDIVSRYGDRCLNKHGELNRQWLRQRIFNYPEEKIWLEQRLHPLILQEMHLRIASCRSPYCIVIIPLLIEKKPIPGIDRILVVDCEEKQQIERASLRDNCAPAIIQAIMNQQISREKRLAAADDIIYNLENIKTLKEQITALHTAYLRISNP